MNWQTRTEHVILWSHTNDSGFVCETSHCRQHERQTRENASVFRSDWWMLEVRSFPVIWLVQPLPNWRFSRHRTRGGRPDKAPKTNLVFESQFIFLLFNWFKDRYSEILLVTSMASSGIFWVRLFSCDLIGWETSLPKSAMPRRHPGW